MVLGALALLGAASALRFGLRQGTKARLNETDSTPVATTGVPMLHDVLAARENVAFLGRDGNCSSWALKGTWGQRKRKIYYAIVVNDELELLEIALEEIFPAVDVIILVESSLTWTGYFKGLHYEANKQLFSKYSTKIRHIVVDFVQDMPNMLNAFGYRFGWDPWEFEEWQRHAIVRGATGIGDEDILFLADVDELVSREYLDAVAKCEPFPNLRHGGKVDQKNCNVMTASIVGFQYHFGCLRKNVHYHPDYTSGICLKRDGINPQVMRTKRVDSRTQIKYYFDHTPVAVGWHMRSFLSLRSWRRKIESFSERDYDQEHVKATDAALRLRETCKHECTLLGAESSKCSKSEKGLGRYSTADKALRLPALVEQDRERFTHLLRFVRPKQWPKSKYTDPTAGMPNKHLRVFAPRKPEGARWPWADKPKKGPWPLDAPASEFGPADTRRSKVRPPIPE